MGTRHLICIFLKGEYKVTQYGQWDGYPDGQGKEVLEFLKNQDKVKRLKINLSRVRFIDDKKDKTFLDSYSKNTPDWSNELDNRTPEQKHWFETYITRDLGAKILNSIADSKDKEILLKDGIDFAEDSLFCEWAYVIDFDKDVLEVYKGFNRNKLDKTERFYGAKGKEGYEPIKFEKSYNLNDLPTVKQFFNDLKEEEED